MSDVIQTMIRFKFHWLDDNGNQTGFRAKKGHFDGELLVLDDVTIPVVIITHVGVRENTMAVTAITQEGEPASAAFNVSKVGAKQLKGAIDAARSASWAEMHKERLAEEGRSAAYRQEFCPHCRATLILTDMPRTPQLFCHFCESLSTTDSAEPPPADERHLKICDECTMFSKPRKFTVLYFYFLVFFYGWHSRATWRCPACMRADAWKMLFGNLLFVIGVPVALVQLYRSYGGAIESGPYRGLDAANLRARKGNVLGALEGYRAILERVPHSAGIKYNLGLGLLAQKDTERAAGSFRAALEDCSNYVPAYHMLCYCYQQLGETEQLRELQAIWGDAEDEHDEAAAVDDLQEMIE